jgi:glycine/D-amino acid oxidase-like deaminating enzyme
VTDLLVIGAGSMGAWTALHAVRGGRKVALVDAYGAGHSRATSGDETRIIRSSHGDDAFYSRWSRTARDAWQALGNEVGERLLVQAGALWFAHRPDGFEAASEATLRGLDIPVERLDPPDVSTRWPVVAADDLAFALHEPEGGLLMARRGVAAAVRVFERESGRFELASVRPGRSEGRRLLDVVDDGGRRRSSDEFVFACGPWLPRLFPEVLGDLIRVTKQDVLFVGPPGGDSRFDSDHLPSWVDYDAAFYGIPGVEGRGPKVAPDRYGPVFDPSHGDRIVDPETVRLARHFMALRFPLLADQPITETRVCQYETTPDTHFIIDRHPDFENVWLVGGGSGHGFKHGPMIGRYVVDRLDGRPPEDDDDRFSLARPRIPSPGMRTGGDSIVSTWEGY